MNIEYVRKNIIGRDHTFESQFDHKQRIVTYADFTASGRSLQFIEDEMHEILKSYANTHTQDNYTGSVSSKLLEESIKTIKQCLMAPDNYKVIICSNGSTHAINKLQQILGLYKNPIDRSRDHDRDLSLVIIGPYEHHSNEISWSCDIVTVGLDTNGFLDLIDLEQKIIDNRPIYKTMYISMSACSNVTGLVTPVKEVTDIGHKYDVPVFFDYAASGPYVPINILEIGMDAIFISGHKFLGGPGSCGLLVFNENLYNKDLEPTVAGGGTVHYVYNNVSGANDVSCDTTGLSVDYISDIEEREMAGTPNHLGLIRLAKAFLVKQQLQSEITLLEHMYLERVYNKLKNHKNIFILGPINSNNLDKFIGIISFNIIINSKVLHPRFVATLLNDLFGIQVRAGCNCAGPYGHVLMNIDQKTSNFYRSLLKKGYHGLKPGWVRLSIHYSMTLEEVDFITKCICFIADYGPRFLKYYNFDIYSGLWSKK